MMLVRIYDVRAEAHMFWWLYRSPQRVNNKGSTPWPTVLWLQGGPVINSLIKSYIYIYIVIIQMIIYILIAGS